MHPYVAVHYRNTDLMTNFTTIVEATRIALSSTTNVRKMIYIATDDITAYGRFKHVFHDCEFIRGVNLQNRKKASNLHYSKRINQTRQVYEALVDLYYLMHADVFIPSPRSSFSAWVNEMRVLPFTNIFTHESNKFTDSVYARPPVSRQIEIIA